MSQENHQFLTYVNDIIFTYEGVVKMHAEEKSRMSKHHSKNNIKKIIYKTTIGVVVTTLSISLAVAGVGLGAVQAFTKNEKIRTKSDFDETLGNFSANSYVYFRDKTQIGMMHRKDSRDLILSSKEVSQYLLDALFATEDREFYNHKGFVPRSILRAAWQSFTGQEDGTGGSTLTQQLVKREILQNSQKSYERKAKELIDANRLEMYYNKEEILVSYMNSVFLGNGANKKLLYGFKAASHGLFNKEVDKLNLPEAAYLAGMVQSPNNYNPNNPFKDPENMIKNGTDRMKLVLKHMLIEKKITQEQYNEAIKYDITKSFASEDDLKEENAMERYPFIMNAVQKEAVDIIRNIDKEKNPERYNNMKRSQYNNYVTSGGLKIYTTIDQKMYDAMENAAKNIQYRTKNIKGRKATEQIGAVIVDNKTGEVLSFVGGADFNKNQMDHAFDARNQPGSAMKPILGYGPALNEGIISPGSNINDEPLAKAGGAGIYKNSNGKYSGPVTATHALKYSLNIPAIKIYRTLLNRLGKDGVYKYTKKVGITPHKNDGESLVLGGATYGFTVKEMTGAYSMFANNGVYNETHLIREIRDQNDKVIYQYKPNPVQVLSPTSASQLTSMLRQVVTSGTAAGTIGAKIRGYNIAGKTGTTSNEWDLWFVGYTPEISMGVWSGYDYNAKGDKLLAKTAWVALFKAAAASNPELIKKGSNFAKSSSSREIQYEVALPSNQPSSGSQPNSRENSRPQQPSDNGGTSNPGPTTPTTPTPNPDPGTTNPDPGGETPNPGGTTPDPGGTTP